MEVVFSKTTSLASSRACTSCRSVKKRCDGALPRCRRCESRNLICEPPATVARRRRIDILEEKLSKLETKLATFAATHTRDLLSQSLFDKLQSLGLPSSRRASVISKKAPLALFPHATLPFMVSCPPGRGKVSEEETDVGYQPVIPRPVVCSLFGTWHPCDGPVPRDFSLCLVRLFLPFRSQFHFYMDPPLFLNALSRPSTDPKSLHPALLSAIYLAACHILSFKYSALEPFFLNQTRAFLNSSLERANRLTHFMWASVILGSYLEMSCRLAESYATVSSCASFALACGLDCFGAEGSLRTAQFPILPPAENPDEEADRAHLVQAIYMMDRSLAIISGFPSVFITIRSTTHPAFSCDGGTSGTAVGETPRDELAEIVQGDLPLNIKAMMLYQRVEETAHKTKGMWFIGSAFSDRYRSKYLALQSALSSFETLLPPLSDPWGIEPFESISPINPYLLVTHATYYGSLLLLHRLAADKDATARTALFEDALSLVNLCSQLRGTRGLRRMQGPLILIPHMINAARVFASYLRLREATCNTQTLAICCESLAVLVDFMCEVTGLYPAWDHVLLTFRELLPGSADTLLAEQVITSTGNKGVGL